METKTTPPPPPSPPSLPRRAPSRASSVGALVVCSIDLPDDGWIDRRTPRRTSTPPKKSRGCESNSSAPGRGERQARARRSKQQRRRSGRVVVATGRSGSARGPGSGRTRTCVVPRVAFFYFKEEEEEEENGEKSREGEKEGNTSAPVCHPPSLESHCPCCCRRCCGWRTGPALLLAKANTSRFRSTTS